jgi:hypothetical protein
MAQGYWGHDVPVCRCCHSGPKDKFWCRSCDHVAKAPSGGTPHCPYCREPMLDMGHRWRPGKKGQRTMAGSWRAQGSIISFHERQAMALLKRWTP